VALELEVERRNGAGQLREQPVNGEGITDSDRVGDADTAGAERRHRLSEPQE
jgi:hypothetical protein